MGVDPGVLETGIAVYSRFQLGRVTRMPGRDHQALVRAVIDTLSTDAHAVLAIEDQRFVARGKTERGESSFAASAVRDIQMLLEGAALARGHAVIYIAPAKAKAALAAGARATKAQMVKAVERRFGRAVTPNEADAVGVALAGEGVILMHEATSAGRRLLRSVRTGRAA